MPALRARIECTASVPPAMAARRNCRALIDARRAQLSASAIVGKNASKASRAAHTTFGFARDERLCRQQCHSIFQGHPVCLRSCFSVHFRTNVTRGSPIYRAFEAAWTRPMKMAPGPGRLFPRNAGRIALASARRAHAAVENGFAGNSSFMCRGNCSHPNFCETAGCHLPEIVWHGFVRHSDIQVFVL